MVVFKRRVMINMLRKMKKRKRKAKKLLQLVKQTSLLRTPVSETYDIHHPDGSCNEYKSIVLQNGLTVLLISDKDSSVSAASMSVKCGSFDDPLDMQGLAHMIEHMFFNGSSKVTKENEFRNLVKMHGGEVFAQTEPEHTVFSFMINNEYFNIGLEMFGHMFNEPLMDINLFKEEIKTLNSEFEYQMCKDTSRLEQLLSHTSPEDHPFNKFTWGNNKSFSVREHEALCDYALKMFRKHFVGASMKLVIIGTEALNELEDLVIKCFSRLKRGPNISFVFPAYKANLWRHGVSYTLESLEDAQSMRITWIIPPVSLTHFETRPEKLIHRLICDESEGSLCYFFKSKHWITSFTASVGHEFTFSDIGNSSFTSTSAGQLFYINLDMTITGLDHKYEMVSYIYQYLHLLRTCEFSTQLVSLIKDYKQALEMKFQCMYDDDNQLGDPMNFSLALAVNMLNFPVSHAISLDFCYDFGDLTAIQDMIRNFNPKNMRIDLLTKTFTKDAECQEEPYFSAKYKEETIPHHYLQKWETSQDVEVDLALHFPQPNSFMPATSFWRVISDDDNPESDDDNPDSDEMEENSDSNEDEETYDDYNKFFWRYQDVTLSTIFLKIYMDVSPGAKSHMVSRIYFEMLKAELSYILYKVDDAYVYPQLSFGDDNTIGIELYGYAGVFKDFLSSLLEKFSFVPSLETFEIITEKMLRQFYLRSRDLIDHAKQLLSEFVIEEQFSVDDKFNAMKSISFEDLQAFLPKTQQIRIVGSFTGTFSELDCRQILGLFKPLGKFQIPRKIWTKKELAPMSRVSVRPITEMERNSLAKVYYQISCRENSVDFNSNRLSAFLHLLKAMVDEKLYCDLRLTQRLGYHMECEVHSLCGTKGFFFYVVSPDHQAEYLLDKIHNFISTLRYYLDSLDDETFKCYRRGVELPVNTRKSYDERCVNDKAIAESFLADMEKKDMLKLYDHFFVEKSSIVEISIGLP